MSFPVKLKTFLNKKINVNSIIDVSWPMKKNVLSLPYYGQNAIKLGRQMNSMLPRVSPWIKLI